MVYRAIGLMSGSSLDGLDIAFAEFQENGGKWSFEILNTECYSYSDEWINKLKVQHNYLPGITSYCMLNMVTISVNSSSGLLILIS
jgi:hypothetical protein